jgi:23S rRNA (guanosine2251-2'-O)-methyltransferase
MTQMVFGFHAVSSILRKQPKSIQRLLVQDDRRDKRLTQFLELARNQGVSVEKASKAVLDQTTPGRHQGVIAFVLAGETSNEIDERELTSYVSTLALPLILILDGVTDPHNLGACLRTADAAGVHLVVVPKNKSADMSPVVRKVASGAAECVPFMRVTNLARVLQELKSLGVWIVGTSGDAEDVLYARDVRGPIALVMGAEGDGMRRLTTEQCDFLVKLPMAGSVSSLNVSVATGVCLFEIVRQRAE